MPPQAGAVFLDLYFLRSAGHLDLGAIIQIARLGALKPDHLATFFCHDTSLTVLWCRLQPAQMQAKACTTMSGTAGPTSITPGSSSPRPSRPSCRLHARRSAASLPWRSAPGVRLR